MDSLLLGKSLGHTLAQNNTNDIVQNTTETLLNRQKSLQENLESLQENLSKKLKLKQHLATQLLKNRGELKQAEEIEQNVL